MTSALIAIADGIEEMETVILSDLLVRAGVEVTLASVSGKTVTASRGLSLNADCLMDDVLDQNYDAIICPGGLPGAEHLGNHQGLKTMILKQHKAGKLVAAICAAPALVLAKHGLLEEVEATGYPSTEEQIPNYVSEPVVVSDHIITSRGPGTAMDLGLQLIESLVGEITAKEIAATALIDR